MLSKNEVKDIQSLSQKKFREERGLFLAEGPKTVSELLTLMPAQAERVYALPGWIEANAQLAGAQQVVEINEAELERITQLQTPNQVLAIFRRPENLVPRAVSLALYLDAIQDPGNMGTIIRIADWFGVPHVVCSAGCADPYSPKVVQSTMASIGRVQVYEDEDGSWLQQQELPLYAAALDGESIYETPKITQGILLIGNESKGLRPALLERATHRITIPRSGGAESLNAAVATGIILSHLVG